MNYAQYLQQGGQTLSIEEQVTSLVQAAIQGDRQANDQINQIMQAAEQGDQKAQQLAQLIQQVAQKLQTEQPEAMKCGGKVRSKMKKACGGKVKAKVKKASCGKKMEKGGETPIKKEAKGGKPCPCTLHKVGGKLIEVDCNGIPVAKNGTKITKFESPSGPVYGDQRRYKNNRLYTFDPQMGGWYANDGLDNDEGVEEYMAQFYQPKQTVNQINPPLTSAQVDQLKQNSMQGVLALDEQRRQREEEIRRNDEAVARVAEEKRKAEEKKNNQYGGLFSGDLRSLQARQTWVRNNADYLRSQGWSDDELNGYKGQAALNLRLANQIAGAKNWNEARPSEEEMERRRKEASRPLLGSVAKAPGVQQSVLPVTQAHDEAKRALYSTDEDFRRYLGKTFTSTKQPPMYAYNVGGTDIVRGENIPDYRKMFLESQPIIFKKQGGLLNYAQYLNLK